MENALYKVGLTLERVGYAEYIQSFNPITMGSGNWLTNTLQDDDVLSGLFGLLAQGQPAHKKSIAKLIGLDHVDTLLQYGLLHEFDSTLHSSGLSLSRVVGYWLWVAPPSPNQLIYVGDDSVGLFLRQSVRRNGRCLDLCSGPGLQTLGASAKASHVDAVEVNPVSAAVATLNFEMNGVEDKITLHVGDLYEPIGQNIYDNVVANPPFIPWPEGPVYPFVGDGGSQGFDIVGKILQGLPSHLATDGFAQVICAVALDDGGRPQIEPMLREWAGNSGFDVNLTIVSVICMRCGSPFFEGLVQTAVAAENQDLESVRSSLNAAYQGAGFSKLGTCFLAAARGFGKVRQRTMPQPAGTLWFT